MKRNEPGQQRVLRYESLASLDPPRLPNPTPHPARPYPLVRLSPIFKRWQWACRDFAALHLRFDNEAHLLRRQHLVAHLRVGRLCGACQTG